MMKGFLVFALLLLQCTCCVHSSRHGRIDHRVDGVVSSSGFIVEPTSQNWPQRDLNWRSTSSCEETYGFMPCSLSALGNLFLMAVYGYLMYVAGYLLTKGRELVVTRPDIIRVFFPMVGSLSDILLILVFGISGSKEIAQGKVMVGMGLITGSTIMLLTAFWGVCLIVGKCDISGGFAMDKQDTQQFNLCASGITVDEKIIYKSRIMFVTFAPFYILGLRGVIQSSSSKRIMDLVASISAIIFLLSYWIYKIYGAVIINNTFCLAVILGIGYIRDLDWDFSAEVLVTLLAFSASSLLLAFIFSTTYKLWKSVIAIIFYLVCLVIFYFRGDSS